MAFESCGCSSFVGGSVTLFSSASSSSLFSEDDDVCLERLVVEVRNFRSKGESNWRKLLIAWQTFESDEEDAPISQTKTTLTFCHEDTIQSVRKSKTKRYFSQKKALFSDDCNLRLTFPEILCATR